MFAALVMSLNVRLCVNFASCSRGDHGGPVSVNGLFLTHLGILILKLYRLVNQLASKHSQRLKRNSSAKLLLTR